MAGRTIDVVVVGLGFGLDFVPVYASHPSVGRVALCDPDEAKLRSIADRYGISDTFTSLEDVLESGEFDAVHLVTPVTLHAKQAVSVLNSGRHVASAVPMGMTLDEIEAVIDATEASGRNFMMMETAVYQREFLYIEELYRSGRLGDITFLRGAHIRDRSEMPGYWRAFPPLKYATHVVSPLLALLGTRAESVRGFGSGVLRPDQAGDYGNPFPIESALLTLEGADVKAEVTQGCFNVARTAIEGFSVYGDRMSVEWPSLDEDDGLTVFTMHSEPEADRERFRRVDVEIVHPDDHRDSLPDELRRFTQPVAWVPAPGLAAISVPSHHGGSHPHLVHEFVTSILEDRPPRIDHYTAADWCAPGIVAHESALTGGELVPVPNFREPAAPGRQPVGSAL
ncbi:Gfo/Idh/MocA family protein [Microbacterium sp. DT81.1]|uniref:Gfo/Idh/MocA family protein n=1 Tax=Microbacterium sp. DT81.1 TaxID=3393413 RepID=UPI003CF50D71